MTGPHLTRPAAAQPTPGAGLAPPEAEMAAPPRRTQPRGAREKLDAAGRGLKRAIRGDSSFFAHAYRGLFLGLTAALLGVGPMGWCLLGIGAALVMLAELFHQAVATLAEALGDDERGLAAREIAAAGGLIATVTAIALATSVLLIKLGDLFGWWR